VSEKTIVNCWNKVGILPSSNTTTIPDALIYLDENQNDESQEILDIVDNIMDDNVKNDLLNYFNDSQNASTNEMLSDDQIVQLVTGSDVGNSDESSEGEFEETKISDKAACDALKIWINYCEQQEEVDNLFNENDISNLRRYLRHMNKKIFNSNRQTKIQSFYQ
jgi:hypothetical protein